MLRALVALLAPWCAQAFRRGHKTLAVPMVISDIAAIPRLGWAKMISAIGIPMHLVCVAGLPLCRVVAFVAEEISGGQ